MASATLGHDARPVLPGDPFAPHWGRVGPGIFVVQDPPEDAWPRLRLAHHESAELEVPAGAQLHFGIGVRPAARSRGPVGFALAVCENGSCREIHSETIDPSLPGGDAWRDRVVALPGPAGRRVRLRFEVRHQQSDPTAWSLPVWSSPVLYAPSERSAGELDLVLLSIDTLGARHLPTYGYHRDTAPFVENTLASRGTVFERCVAPATTTGPSHMTLFTGLPPTLHGVSGPISLRLPQGIVTLAEALRMHGFATGAVTGDGPLAAARGFARGFDSYVENTGAELGEPRGQIDATLAGARAWLDRHRHVRRFLFLHTYQVHGPYAPPQAYQPLFLDGSDEADTESRGSALAYDQEIRYVDDELARFFQELESQGAWDHTLFLLLSDHGEAFGEHGSFRHGADPYEEVLHVPCLVLGPGIAAGRRIEGPLGLGDWMPTLLELMGLPRPSGLWGRSAAAVLRGDAESDWMWQRPVFAGAFSSGRLSRLARPNLVVRLGDHKLVRRQPTARETRFEYYDLATDPDERDNRYDESDPQVRKLVALLEDFGARSDALRRQLRPVSAGEAPAEPDPLEAERTERLRALGYID